MLERYGWVQSRAYVKWKWIGNKGRVIAVLEEVSNQWSEQIFILWVRDEIKTRKEEEEKEKEEEGRGYGRKIREENENMNMKTNEKKRSKKNKNEKKK